VPEPPSLTRSAFRRDCDRIIHSTAFRRLGYKTQVFVYHEGDHYRTRLTHTLEVAQIARSIARALGLDEDLAEALALAHDLGHPPFGHAGERALDGCLEQAGGFDHNAQSLRVVTALERRYADFDGLNLSWETLEGLVKHNGPLIDPAGKPLTRYQARGLPRAIRDYNARQDLQLASFASAEAQVAAIADDIAYNAHDIDDGLRAGLFGIADIAHLPIVCDVLDARCRDHPHLEPARMAHEIVRSVITRLIEDVVLQSQARLENLAPRSPDDIRRAAASVIAFSPAIAGVEQAFKQFLYPRMYRHARVARVMNDAERVVSDLFEHYLSHPTDMPEEWRDKLDLRDGTAVVLQVGDFIAGMTDRYALAEYARFFAITPELR
jgi:dGTPase